MKVAVTAQNKNLESLIDSRFGRCQNFLIVDTDTLDFKVIENTSKSASQGAGIASAQTIINENVEVLITGKIGPNAYNVFKQAGTKVFSCGEGSVKEIIEEFKKGSLVEVQGPNNKGVNKGGR